MQGSRSNRLWAPVSHPYERMNSFYLPLKICRKKLHFMNHFTCVQWLSQSDCSIAIRIPVWGWRKGDRKLHQNFSRIPKPHIQRPQHESWLQVLIFNYDWMRLSRIWRILQVEESVIRPRWITPSEICRILHILRKPISIIALLFIQNIFFAQTCKLYSRPVLSLLNDTTLCPGFLGQWFNNLWRQ